jgi:hypothetical protein
MIIPFLALILCTGSALAANITIWDENGYSRENAGGEDQETEPGMVNSQAWDLEGFIFNGSVLTMVGGYDFANGESGGGHTFHSGDLFISTTGKPVFGADDYSRTSRQTTYNKQINNSFGYNYVIDLDFNNSIYEYNVYAINQYSKVLASYYYGYGPDGVSNQASDPWRFDLEGTKNDSDGLGLATLITSGEIGYETGLSDGDTGFLGGSHNAVTIALDFLGVDTDFYAHFAMQCGNDNLMGEGTTTAPVPEPATVLLFGTGFVGFAGFRRKFRKG